MQSKNWGVSSPKTEYSLVYYYLIAGIGLMVTVFLFLSRGS